MEVCGRRLTFAETQTIPVIQLPRDAEYTCAYDNHIEH